MLFDDYYINKPSDSLARDVFIYYQKNILPRSKWTPNVEKKIKARLKHYSVADLKEAIDKFKANAWYMKNCAHRGPLWFFNSDQRIEKDMYIVPEEVHKSIKLI